MRIAERVGDLDVRANPTLGRRALQVCGGALADAFDSIWTREPATAKSAIRDAVAALDQWAQFRRRQWESERQEPPPSMAAHVLVAPSLAELTVASVRDGSADLTEMYGAAELPSQHMLLRLAGSLTGGSCEVTVDELLELDDTDLRYALEGIALHRKLWRVAGICDGSTLRGLCRRRREVRMAVMCARSTRRSGSSCQAGRTPKRQFGASRTPTRTSTRIATRPAQ